MLRSSAAHGQKDQLRQAEGGRSWFRYAEGRNLFRAQHSLVQLGLGKLRRLVVGVAVGTSSQGERIQLFIGPVAGSQCCGGNGFSVQVQGKRGCSGLDGAVIGSGVHGDDEGLFHSLNHGARGVEVRPDRE